MQYQCLSSPWSLVSDGSTFNLKFNYQTVWRRIKTTFYHDVLFFFFFFLITLYLPCKCSLLKKCCKTPRELRRASTFNLTFSMVWVLTERFIFSFTLQILAIQTYNLTDGALPYPSLILALDIAFQGCHYNTIVLYRKCRVNVHY